VIVTGHANALVEGDALMVAVGVEGAAFTVTVALAFALPPGPAHVSVYVLVPVVVGVSLIEPLVASVPDHAPDAVHDVAFVEPHVSVVGFPRVRVEGDALMVASVLVVTIVE
jgi:hypothetical protein